LTAYHPEGRTVKPIQLTIDKRDVSVPQGSTVLDAIRAAGLNVPTLCHDAHLKPYGACRLCIVEIKGLRGLPTSCTTPAAENMVVVTETEEIRRIRRNIVALAIAGHPADCLTCFKSQECELLAVARDLGVDRACVDRLRRSDSSKPLDSSNPAFVFDPNKCILCGKCVRVCHEIQGLGAIDFASRGFNTRISTFGAKALVESICQSCGECVEHCPTGALVPKRFAAPQQEVLTICPFCGVGCSMAVGVRGQQIVSVRGDRQSPVNQGGLCVKGRFGLDFVHHPERLKRPLIRKDGVLKSRPDGDPNELFREVDWDEALDCVASRLQHIRQHNGPRAVGVLSSAKCTNEDNYLIQKFARAVIGTNNVDHCARLCHASTVTAAMAAFGSGAMSNSIDDIARAEALLVIGANSTECHPIIARRIKQNVRQNDARLVVADPRVTELAEMADVHLSHRPGTDVALLNALMHEILRLGLQDDEFISQRCEDFGVFRESLVGYDPGAVAAVTGVPVDRILGAARILGEAPTMVVVYGMGITQHTTGTDNVKAVANLLMLTGNMGLPGTGFSPLRGQNNVQGACDMGALPNVLPGYQSVSQPLVRSKFGEAWGVELDSEPGLALTEMVAAAHEGLLRGMYIVGENPLMSEPDLGHARQALEKLDFLAVQDIFVTETARRADVVLPATSFAEKDGTFTNTERRIQLLRKVLDPPGAAREDWKIVVELASRLGKEMRYSSTADIMREIAALVPIYAGVSHARLQQPGGLQWPCLDSEHRGTPRLHGESFTRGRGKFHVVDYQPPAESPSEDYPLVLTTGRVLEHWHTGSMSRRSHVLQTLSPNGRLDLCPEDAEALGAAEGASVDVASRRGRIHTTLHRNRRVPKGLAFMAFHWQEAPANVLTNPACDPVSKIPEYKVSAVKVRAASEGRPQSQEKSGSP
jgi:formate dehydrogenase alpha subunit